MLSLKIGTSIILILSSDQEAFSQTPVSVTSSIKEMQSMFTGFMLVVGNAADKCREYVGMPLECLEIYFWRVHVKNNS